MSTNKLLIRITGLSIALEADTKKGYHLLDQWLRLYRKNSKPDFLVRFCEDKNLFTFSLENGSNDTPEKMMHMFVRMGQVDLKKKYAFGPDVSLINKELAQYIFSNFLRITLQYILPHFGGILVHASGISDKQKGYVFIGPNEGGKSTLAKNSGKKVLSDDCVGLVKRNGTWHACSTPWGSSSHAGTVPLQGIYFISKSQELNSSPISQLAAVKKLFSSICTSFPLTNPQHTETIENLFTAVEQICREIPAFNLNFRKKDNVFDEITGNI
ncbi:MAG: hypothetical protein JXB26_16715 [Candidatus Aminicenantes bacterium]|nr:hypothetical protein [Candidatus Aminicenantes bacterium]